MLARSRCKNYSFIVCINNWFLTVSKKKKVLLEMSLPSVVNHLLVWISYE